MTDAVPPTSDELAAWERLCDEATPEPWAWGDDWNGLAYSGRDGGGDKYADLTLLGNEGQDIIPLRIDHYEPIWDIGPADIVPHAADRAFIVAARSALPRLIAALWDAREENARLRSKLNVVWWETPHYHEKGYEDGYDVWALEEDGSQRRVLAFGDGVAMRAQELAEAVAFDLNEFQRTLRDT